ncbi:hypothetical protein ULF88_25925 [Halopseudomonas pachastrellae]|nr:hypothetical protein [Halopseudomonas pachastrellae]
MVGTTQTERTNLNTEWFFSEDAGQSQCARFIEWLSVAVSTADDALRALVKGTALNGVSADQLRRTTAEAIKTLQARWLDEYRYLVGEELQAKPDSPYQKRLRMEKNRLCKEYLLRDLALEPSCRDTASRPMLLISTTSPSRIISVASKATPAQNETGRTTWPATRAAFSELSIAIREYAPVPTLCSMGVCSVPLAFRFIGTTSTPTPTRHKKLNMAWRCDACGSLGYEEGLVKGDALICTNRKCGATIKASNTRKVLEPAGFVTDAYVNATNDIEHQRYIPVEPSWIFVDAASVPLPNPALGSMAYGVNGRVFNHSLGATGAGYALCMSCGRAESMLAHDQFPPSLSPSSDHVSRARPKRTKTTTTRGCLARAPAVCSLM